MNPIETQIQQRLREIETADRVRILYAVESGSRAWGFASPNSDYDVRFIYARPIEEYLRLRPRRDVIERPLEDDLDISGWDLLKTLNLFRASNPPLLEWLRSPIVYREEGELADRLRELAQTHTSARRMTYHYLNMARNTFNSQIHERPEVSLKKYLYVLRPLFAIRWMEQYRTPAPTALTETLAGLALPGDVETRLGELLERKRAADELGTGAPDPVLNGFAASEIARVTDTVASLPDPTLDENLLNALFRAELGLEP